MLVFDMYIQKKVYYINWCAHSFFAMPITQKHFMSESSDCQGFIANDVKGYEKTKYQPW